MAEQTSNNTNSGTSQQSDAIFEPKVQPASTEKDIAITKTENTVHEPAEKSGAEPSQPPQEQKSQAEQVKSDDGKEPKAEAPKELKLEVPKDSPVPPGVVEMIAQYSKEQGLSNEEAQTLLNREHQARVDYQKMVSGWKQKVLDDPEIGGQNAPKNVELAKRVWRRFADQELIQEAEDSGLADHPGLVKLMVRIGRLMSEDQFINSSVSTTTPKDPVDVFYGQKSS